LAVGKQASFKKGGRRLGRLTERMLERAAGRRPRRELHAKNQVKDGGRGREECGTKRDESH